MNKRNYFATVVVLIGIAVSSAALYRPHQTAPSSSAATPIATPTPPPSFLGIKAYTDSLATDYGDCFQQESTSKKTLYLKAYAAFPVKQGTARFDLYQYQADGSLKYLTAMTKYDYYKNTIKITVTDSTPPHLGPGPYEGVVSADLILPGNILAKTTVLGTTYYDTYKMDYHECWRQQY